MGKPNENEYDVAVVGGGPGGFAAALWCGELGLRTAVFEKENEFGGQLLHIHNEITNYPGVIAGDGRELRDLFFRHFATGKFEWRPGSEIDKFDPAASQIETKDAAVFWAGAFVFATGVRRRTLNIPGEEKFAGRGILGSGVRDRHLVTGKRVVIVGGGDAAIENASILAESALHVTVIHRREELTARKDLFSAAESRPNVAFMKGYTVSELRGEGWLSSLSVVNTRTGQPETIEADFLLERIGVIPNSELLKENVVTADDGYIEVDSLCRTSIEGIFAVGDVACRVSPTIATAVGMGATAAKAAYEYLGRRVKK